jgi:hypothetical protein
VLLIVMPLAQDFEILISFMAKRAAMFVMDLQAFGFLTAPGSGYELALKARYLEPLHATLLPPRRLQITLIGPVVCAVFQGTGLTLVEPLDALMDDVTTIAPTLEAHDFGDEVESGEHRLALPLTTAT